MKFRVLKGVKDVYLREDGKRVLVLHPKANRKQKAFQKSYQKPVAVKMHYTHVVYPTDKARARPGMWRNDD